MFSYRLGTANGFHWNQFALDPLGRIWNNTLTDPYQAGKFKLLREYKRKRCSKKTCFWVASTDATHIFVWNWGSKMAAFPVMVPDFFVL